MENKKALLAVSFGTSHEETRKKTIDAIEKDLQDAFPDRKLFRAWTSGFIRRKVEKTTGIRYDSAEEALERIISEGFSDLLVQPVHMAPGEEYGRLKETLEKYRMSFASLKDGKPLLSCMDDIERLADAVIDLFSGVSENEMLCLMGHGSSVQELPVYDLLDQCFREKGRDNICVGTVEFEPGIAPVIQRVRERRPVKVYLAPLLVVAGDHAVNDMAGDDPDSWKMRIGSEGPAVECILKGMGEYGGVRRMYVDHAKQAAGKRCCS